MKDNKPFTQEEIVKLLCGKTKQTNISMICKCHRNYRKACKKPDKYKTGGCK